MSERQGQQHTWVKVRVTRRMHVRWAHLCEELKNPVTSSSCTLLLLLLVA